MARSRRHIFLASTAALSLLGPVALWAQDGGLQGTLRLGEELRYDDNPDFDESGSQEELSARTNLSFNLNSTTTSQSLTLTLSGAIDVPLNSRDDRVSSNDDVDFVDPFARLSYSRSNRTTALTLSGFYRLADVNDTLPDDFDPEDVIFDPGEREDFGVNFGLEFGRQAPFGGVVDFSQRERQFRDTNDPGLFDTSEYDISTRLNFELTPRFTASLIGERDVYDAEDNVSTYEVTNTYGVGGSLIVNRTLRLTADLLRDEIDTERNTGDTETDGLGLVLGSTQDLPNGSFSLDFSTRERFTGRRTELSFSRDMATLTGSFSYGVGITQSEDTDLAPLFNLTYVQDRTDGALSIGLDQGVRIDNEDEDVIDSRLSVNYSKQVNSLSSWSAGLRFANTIVQNDDSDSRRLDLNARYSHDVGQDWSLVGGFTHSRGWEENGDDRVRNIVFLSLEKDFSFRP